MLSRISGYKVERLKIWKVLKSPQLRDQNRSSQSSRTVYFETSGTSSLLVNSMTYSLHSMRGNRLDVWKYLFCHISRISLLALRGETSHCHQNIWTDPSRIVVFLVREGFWAGEGCWEREVWVWERFCKGCNWRWNISNEVIVSFEMVEISL